MKKTSFLLLGLLFLASQNVQSQSTEYLPQPKYPVLFKTLPSISPSEPEWVKLMYSENPNYYEVVDAFREFYAKNALVKNTHTQNFKHWSRILKSQDYVLGDGTIYMPTAQERREADAVRKSIQESQRTEAANSWSPVGPMETFNPEGGGPKSSQVNAYTFDQSQSNPNVLYMGAETGGVYKSTDKGLNWTSVGDDVFNDGGIGVVKIDPTNENTVYVGVGYKLYKTTDGGANWSTLLDITSLHLTAITINPNDPQVVLIAGNLGLKRSTNGGTTWNDIITDKCWDIQLKTDDPNTVFVSKSNNTRNITEVWKSTNNGQNFTSRLSGWFSPTGNVAITNGGARIGVTNANSNRLYVILLGSDDSYAEDNNYIGIYRSDDAGESWHTPYDGNGDGQPDNEPGGPYSDSHWCFTYFGVNSGGYDQGFYDLAIDVSDTDADAFLVGSLNLFKSNDGGTSYVRWGGYGCDGCGTEYRHPDIQDIEINGSDAWVCSDGGVDYYDGNLDFVVSRNNGLNGSDYWGFDQGWNHDVLVGGRYHNGNAAYYQDYASGQFVSLGGAEAATGYVNQGENRKVYHSDISGKLIPETIAGDLQDISGYGMYPNEHYWFDLRSEIVTDPTSWSTLYLGKDNNLWKSINYGASYELLKAFGTEVTDLVKGIEVSRNDPGVIYVTQDVGASGKLWKSTDAGMSWTEVSVPASHQTMYISLNTDDELYLALRNSGTSTDKVFKSTNGGASWTNLSTSTLDGERIENVQVQEGTNGGVYLTSNQTVWYRNNSHSDWQSFGEGLPVGFRVAKIIPFYKDGKVRMAGNRGVWERDFFEPSAPKAQPFASTASLNCDRDFVQFEDYSILNHAGASWLWSFPGAATVSSTTARNPVVTYATPGTYDVTLTVTDGTGASDSKTLTNLITVGESICSPEPEASMAMECAGSPQYATNDNILESNVTNFTFTAWVKPSGIQPDFSGIFSLSSGDDNEKNVLNFREGNNTLGFHWNGGHWGWDSNLIVPADEWSFVAITVTPTAVTLHVNEQSVTNPVTTTAFELNRIMLGTYYAWTSRNYSGLIEEATFWKRTLTQNEIRLARHLTKMDVSDPDMIAYYQFNHDIAGKIYDKKNAYDLSLTGGAHLVGSTAPVGSGASQAITVNSGGVKNFDQAELSLEFPSNGTYPNGDVVVSRINHNPNGLPNNDLNTSAYWVVNNYGTNTNFSELGSITFDNAGVVSASQASTPSVFEMYKRGSNNEGDSWGSLLDNADAAVAGDQGSVTFSTNNGVTSFSQFVVANSDVVVCSATVPSGLNISSIGETSATASWSAVANVVSYDYQYRTTGASSWTEVNTTSTSVNISGLIANTEYEVQVRSNCSDATSNWSASAIFTTQDGGTPCTVSVPTGLSSSGITTSTADISWGAQSSTTAYDYQYRTTGAASWTVVNTTSTSASLSGLSAETEYEFQVRAICPDQTSAYSASANFTTDEIGGASCDVAPAISASGITESSATISWPAITGATNHTYRYRLASGGAWTTGSTTASSVTISGLNANTEYNVRLRAACTTGSSPMATLNFTTTDGGVTCDVPGGLTSSNVGETSSTISWNSVSAANTYDVRYRETGVVSWVDLSVSSTSSVLSALVANTAYEFQVQSNCSDGVSGYSASANFTTSGGAVCDVPSGLASSGIGETSVTISWNSVGAANTYDVRYRETGAATWLDLSVSNTSTSLTGLIADTDYEYQVQSNCTSEVSGYSASSNFTTTGGGTGTSCDIAPQNLSASTTNASATITWSAVDGATSYTYKNRQTSGGGSSNGTVTSNSVTITGLSANTSYTFSLRSSCNTGNSPAGSLTYTTGSAARTVERVENNGSVKAFPNPVANGNDLLFTNLTENATFTLFDAAGSEIEKHKIAAHDRVTISNLKGGVYFYHVETSSKMYTGKLVIE